MCLYLVMIFWPSDLGRTEKDVARCKSLMRRIFVTVLQSGNPAHVDAGDPCWDPCQFCFYLRGTMSSCTACVGTPCWDLKEKCQYCVGGQSTHTHTHTSRSWGDAPLLNRSTPSLFSSPGFLWNRLFTEFAVMCSWQWGFSSKALPVTSGSQTFLISKMLLLNSISSSSVLMCFNYWSEKPCQLVLLIWGLGMN